MNKVKSFLKDGMVVLKKVDSPINGELTVAWSIGFGYQILGGGLWQVGGPVTSVWKQGLSIVSNKNIKSILILGLGGGTAAGIARSIWKNAKIVGIDVDPVIVELGISYLALSKFNLEIVYEDALSFLKSDGNTYDLILVDTYVGDNFPTHLEGNTFLNLLEKHMNKDGVLLANRLFYGEKRKGTLEFLKQLEKIFKVDAIYPESNVLYLCQRK